MEKTKLIDMGEYSAYINKIKRYTSLHLELIFEMELTIRNILKTNLLFNYMNYTNKKYKTLKEIQDREKELYSLGFNMSSSQIGSKFFGLVTARLFDPKRIGDDYFKDAIEFICDMLYKPNFENGKLDKTILDRRKNMMIESFGNKLTSPDYKAYKGFLRATFNDPKMFEELNYDTKEDFAKALNSITDKELIDWYNEIIGKSFVTMTLVGDYDDKELDLIKEKFKFPSVRKLDDNYHMDVNIPTTSVTVQDYDISESTLYVLYEIDDYKDKDRCAYKALKMMLNYDSGRIIHKVLRDEFALVYNASMSLMSKVGTVLFTASIESKNKDACIKAIDTILDRLKDKKYVQEELDKVKKTVKMNDYLFDESKWNITYDVETIALNEDKCEEENKDLMLKLNADDIIDAVNRLRRKVVYFYEGKK